MTKYIVAVVALYACPVAAWAQPVVGARSLADLQSLVKPGQVIHVHDWNGDTTQGTVRDVTDAALNIDTTGADRAPRTFASAPLSAYWKRDSLKNGVAIGAASGVVAAVALTVAACQSYCEYGESYAFLGIGLLTIPSGMAIGALVDRAFERDELHIDFQRPATKQVNVAPVITSTTRGAMLVFRF